MNKQLEIILEASKDVMGKSFTDTKRYRDFVFKRSVYYRCCRQLTNVSLNEVGRSIGRDHATVLHGLKVFDMDIASGNYPEYYTYYRDVIRVSSIKLNDKITDLTSSKEKMLHTIINQRQKIKQMEAIINGVESVVKFNHI